MTFVSGLFSLKIYSAGSRPALFGVPVAGLVLSCALTSLPAPLRAADTQITLGVGKSYVI